MTGMTRGRALTVYVAAVISAGLGLLIGMAVTGGIRDVVHAPTAFWVFSIFPVIGEAFPILIPRANGEADETTMSTTFAFALVLAFGPAMAAITQAVASSLADAAHRKELWKIAFNAGQYTLSIGASGAVYRALGGDSQIGTSDLGAVAIAGLTFFVVNTSLTSIGLALAQDARIPTYLWRDLRFDAFTSPVLVALSPAVVVVAERSLWLVPLVASPALAVYWGTTLALENTRLVEQLQGSLEHMTELNRMKDDFVAVVSHELRTPLTSIQGYIKTLLQLSPDLHDAQRQTFLEAADRQGERLARLIEQLLVVARLESHVEPLIVGPVSFSRLAGNVVDELRPRAHGHVFDVRIAHALPEVITDEAKLHQILSNLVENALKYSPPDTRVTLRVDPSPGGVLMGVEDEGPGIPADEADLVFERFYQIDSSATRRVGGTGLGLYICRRMAEAIGARLWLAKSDESGSDFCLFVPERAPLPDPADPQSMTASVWPVSTT
jgi:signal transduction histidine kinase